MGGFQAIHRLLFNALRSLRAKLVAFGMLVITPCDVFGYLLLHDQERHLECRARASLVTDARRLADHNVQWLGMSGCSDEHAQLRRHGHRLVPRQDPHRTASGHGSTFAIKMPIART